MVKAERTISFPMYGTVQLGVEGLELRLEREIPVPMEVVHLLANAPAVGMFELESYAENGEELLAPMKDDLWLHRPTSTASSPAGKHSARVTRVAMRVRSTGVVPSKAGLFEGQSFTLVVHVVGRPARPL